MVSRDSKVQLAVVAMTMVLATLWVRLGTPDAVTSGLFVVACYVLLFAGSHVYLAARGDGEDVPVAARWRFVGLVSFAVVALLVANTFGGVELVGYSLSTVVPTLVGVVFASYVIHESWDAYLATRPD